MIPIMSGGRLRVALDQTIYSWSTGAATVLGSSALWAPTPDLGDPDSVWRTQQSVRTVVGFLARNVAQIPLHAFRRTDQGRVRVTDGDIAAGLVAPHPAATGYEHMFSLVVDRCLHDRYCALKLVTPDGNPMLVRLPPKQWRFTRDLVGLPTGVSWQRSDGELAEFSLSDVLFLDGHWAGWAGVESSPMEALKTLLTEQYESGEYRTQLWRGGARIPGVIERPDTAPFWSVDGRQAFKDSWQAYAAAGVRAGKTPVLEDGMSYREVKGISPVDAQQLEARKLSIAEVAAAFHIPPVFVGLLDNANYSNVGAFRESLYSDVLGPEMVQIQQAFNARWVPDVASSDVYVEFNVAEKLRMAFEEQARILQSAVGAPIMTRNEARTRMNLSEIDGGDDLIVPLNVATGTAGVSPQELVTMVQKVYLGVGVVISAEEARDMLRAAGATLPIGGLPNEGIPA